MYLHAGGGLMILEVTGQPEVRDPNVPLLIKEDIRRL